jgi:hypothetical protein
MINLVLVIILIFNCMDQIHRYIVLNECPN